MECTIKFDIMDDDVPKITRAQASGSSDSSGHLVTSFSGWTMGGPLSQCGDHWPLALRNLCSYNTQHFQFYLAAGPAHTQ